MEQSRMDGLYKIRVGKIYIRAYLENQIPENTALDIEEIEQAKLLENMIQTEPQAIKFEKENACRQRLNKTQADSYLEQAEMKTEKGESKEQHMGASYKRFHFEHFEKQRVTEYHLREEQMEEIALHKLKGQEEQNSTQNGGNIFLLKPSTTSKDRKHFATRQKNAEIVSDQIVEIKRNDAEKQRDQDSTQDDGNCFFLKPSTTSKDRKHFAVRQKRTEIVSDQIAEIKRSDAEKQKEQDSTQNDDGNCFFLKPSTTSKDRKHFATRQKRTEIVSDQIAEIKRSDAEKQKEQDSTQNDDGNCFFLKPSTTSKDQKHFATRQKRTEIVSDQIAEIKRNDAEKQKEQDSTQNDDGNCFFLKPSTTSKDRKHFATRQKRTEIVSDQIAEIKRSDAEKQKEQDSTQDDGNCFFLKPSTTSKDRKHFAVRQKRTEIVSDQIAEIKRSDAEKQKEQDSTQDDENSLFLKPSTTSKDRKHFATRQKRTEIVSDQIAEIKRNDAEKQKEQDSTQNDDGNCFFLKPSTTSKDRKHFAVRQKRTEIVSDQIAEIKRSDAEKQKEQDSTQDDGNCFFLKPSTTSKDRKHFAVRQKKTEIVSDQIAEIKRSDAEKQRDQDSTQDDGNCFFLKPSTTSKDGKHFAVRQKRTEIVSDQIAEIKRSDAEKQKEQDSTQNDDGNCFFLKPSTTSKDRKHFATRQKRTEIVSDQIAEIKRHDAEKQKEQDSTQNDDGNCFFLKPSTTSKDRKHFAVRQKRTEIVSDQIAEIKRRNAEREEKSLEFVKSKGTEGQQEKQRASNKSETKKLDSDQCEAKVLQSQFLKSGLKDQTLRIFFDSEDLAEETWNSNVDSHDFTKLFISVTEAQVGHPSPPTRLPTNVQTTNSPCSSVSEISAQGRVPKPPSGKPTYVNSRKSSHRLILETDAKVTAPKPQKLKPIIIHSKNSSYPFTSDKDAQMGPPKLPSIKRRNDEGRNSYLRYNSPRDTQERSTELPAITIKKDQNFLSYPVKPRYLVLPPIINKVNIIFSSQFC
ncbi:calponin homology domain-containing protein DDB_G0272472-like [Fundulus heteroclitus]|uniref:calponin homology domain-containing protein DDB_G0272472-like n=1 Tax=Fundulus heteroclitus TaxID=8078 RepID=UPI00165A4961|nr:calponin homology domain-containing protein DDB_G0272472-like [Fundulus heteroclitus]